MYIILVYDISQEANGAKATRNIFKICKRYLSHVQKSVFEGEITPGLLSQLESELDHHIRPELDSVVIFTSRNKKWLDKKFLGKNEEEKTSNFF